MKNLRWPIFFMAFLFISSLQAQQHGQIKTFRLKNKIDIEMVWLTPGEFLMGSPESETERYAEREKQHSVKLTKGFWIATTETTQKVWQIIMANNPSKIIAPDHPVEQVSWNDVQRFIEQLNENGAQFRLPYEAEWEYACRAGTTTAYAGQRDEMTWHFGNSNRSTHPVASKSPNAWGLYDMHGNVSERCQDWFIEDISSYNLDPKGPEEGTKKVERGGQYTGRIRHTRSADRSGAEPYKPAFFVGFRLVHD